MHSLIVQYKYPRAFAYFSTNATWAGRVIRYFDTTKLTRMHYDTFLFIIFINFQYYVQFKNTISILQQLLKTIRKVPISGKDLNLVLLKSLLWVVLASIGVDDVGALP